MRRAASRAARRAAAAFAAALLGACSDGEVVVQGTGEVVQERRVLRATDAIVLGGRLDVSIEVSAREDAPETAVDTVVWIEGASDLLEYVETEIDGAALRIGTRDGARLDPNPRIEIHASRLLRLAAGGIGTVRVDGVGAGVPPGAVVVIEAAGEVDVHATGEAERLVLRQGGACDLHLSGLIARSVDHSSAGAGDAWIHATESLRTKIVGVGDVHLRGGATVERTILGSGEVVREPGDG